MKKNTSVGNNYKNIVVLSNLEENKKPIKYWLRKGQDKDLLDKKAIEELIDKKFNEIPEELIGRNVKQCVQELFEKKLEELVGNKVNERLTKWMKEVQEALKLKIEEICILYLWRWIKIRQHLSSIKCK